MIISPFRSRSGFTLIELAAVLATLGIALSIAVPAVRGTLDGLTVRTARDAIAAELARARLLARINDGAVAVLDADVGAAWVESPTGDALASPVHVTAQHDVRLDLGDARRVRIVYDRFGIGRLANRSIRLVRNDAEARLTISAYGRVRPW